MSDQEEDKKDLSIKRTVTQVLYLPYLLDEHTHYFSLKYLCLFVFYVPSTVRLFRDGTPIYCPLRRTWSSVNTPFPPGVEPRAVGWQSITLPLRHASSTLKYPISTKLKWKNHVKWHQTCLYSLKYQKLTIIKPLDFITHYDICSYVIKTKIYHFMLTLIIKTSKYKNTPQCVGYRRLSLILTSSLSLQTECNRENMVIR